MDKKKVVICDRFIDSTLAYQVYTKKIDNENDKTTENSTDETIINVDETINQFEQEENAKKKEEEEEEKKNEKKEEEA